MTSTFPTVDAKTVLKALKKVGFVEVRQSGSHVILKRTSDNRRIVVPIHSSKALKRKTLKAILNDADISIEEFNRIR